MPITPEKIAVALGQTAPLSNSVTERQWLMWIADAALLINIRNSQMNFVAVIDEAKLDYVIREAVVAQVKKPDDATQVTIAVDDSSSTRSYQSGKGRVTIIDEWWALLGLMPQDEAFTIDMIGGVSYHLPWCASYFGAAYCSCGVDIAGYPIFENIN